MIISRESIDGYRARLLLLAALAASTLLSCGLLLGRFLVSGSRMYSFLGFNLFLAWLPFVFAAAVYWIHLQRKEQRVGLVALGVLWLLFLPNAPYLWTDLVHVVIRRSVSVYWCDLVLALTFGWNGMLLGLLSLQMVHRVTRDLAGVMSGWVLVIVALGLSSFSISLGRLERFNSWDVFTRPIALLRDIGGMFLNFRQHGVHFAMSALFFAFLVIAYVMLLALLAAGREDPDLDPHYCKPVRAA